ncbi:MAG: class I SAM-dependent methyltransferase [Candidatus Omnitrophota bacterium]
MSACYICKSNKAVVYKKTGLFTIFHCKECGLKWVDKALEQATSFYDMGYFNNNSTIGYNSYLKDEINHRKNAKKILNMVSKIRLLSGLKILDIGCAFGFLLDEAKKQANCQVQGVEISNYAYEYAKNKFCLDVLNSELKNNSFLPNTFDIIFMIGTIEHLTNPKETLSNIKNILKPDGLLIITTIDTKGFFPLYAIKPPEHLFYFNHNNLTQLLKQEVLEIIKIQPHFSSYYLYNIIYRLGEFTSLEFLRRASMLIEKLLPQLNFNIPTNEMFVIAKKI